jgi:hypothetical protein
MFSIGQSRIHRAFASSQRKHLDHAACRPLRSFSARTNPVSARRASGLGFVAQPSNPDSFVVNRRNTRGLSAASTPIPLMTWPPRRPGSVLVLWPNQQTVMLGFVEQPRNPTVLCWNHRKPRMQASASPRQASGPPSLSPPAPGRSTQSCPVQWLGCYLAPAHVHFVLLLLPPCGPHLILFGHRVHRAEPTCLSTPRRTRKAKIIRARSSPAPTQIKLQPAPAILGQESLHTMLSTTHHTKERPSTGPRTPSSSNQGITGIEVHTQNKWQGFGRNHHIQRHDLAWVSHTKAQWAILQTLHSSGLGGA